MRYTQSRIDRRDFGGVGGWIDRITADSLHSRSTPAILSENADPGLTFTVHPSTELASTYYAYTSARPVAFQRRQIVWLGLLDGIDLQNRSRNNRVRPVVCGNVRRCTDPINPSACMSYDNCRISA